MNRNTGSKLKQTETNSERANANAAANLRAGRSGMWSAVRLTVVLLAAVLAIALLQSAAVEQDHQNANLASLGIGLLATLYVLAELQLLAMRRSRPFLVPLLAVVGLALTVLLFRFDGFSGEMWPQFRLRFVGEPELQKLSDSAPVTPLPADGSQREHNRALQPALGFLGSRRQVGQQRREFSIPTNLSQLERLWDHGIGDGWSSFAVLEDRAVTLEQRGDREAVSCYRLGDGKLMWIKTHEARHEHPLGGIGPRSTPTIDVSTQRPRVFAQGATGRLWCIDLGSGEVIWQVDLIDRVNVETWDRQASEAAITWGRAGSPLVVDPAAAAKPAAAGNKAEHNVLVGSRRLCICSYGGPQSLAESGRSLIALNADSGETVWTSGEDQISYASPVLMTLAGVRQIVSVNEKTITGHAVEDGHVLWSFEWPGNSNADANCASPVQAGPNQILVGKGYGGGSALIEVTAGDDRLEATSKWQSSRVLKTKFTHACVKDGVAYAISNGSLEAVEVASGRRLWQQPRGSRYQQGQILLVEDLLVAQAESGEVALVAADPEAFRELLRIPALDSKTWNVPTVAGRHLLVRNDRQAICFLLPPRER